MTVDADIMARCKLERTAFTAVQVLYMIINHEIGIDDTLIASENNILPRDEWETFP
jgi:hypothetical protein